MNMKVVRVMLMMSLLMTHSQVAVRTRSVCVCVCVSVCVCVCVWMQIDNSSSSQIKMHQKKITSHPLKTTHSSCRSLIVSVTDCRCKHSIERTTHACLCYISIKMQYIMHAW